MKSIGLIINPIAGMGGKVGLKGTDGIDIQEEAIKRGAVPIAPSRTKRLIQELVKFPEINELEFLVPEGIMGENTLKTISGNFRWKVINQLSIPISTSRIDTINAAKVLKRYRVDLIIFVGGDGTARDIIDAVGDNFPVLGIPSGVKMHSGVFVQGIDKGVQLIRQFIRDRIQFVTTEIIDLDESAFRDNRINTKIYGIGLVPSNLRFMQVSKSVSTHQDLISENMEAIMQSFKKTISQDRLYILGAGSTLKMLAKAFGDNVYDQKTLLGIDLILNNMIIAKDVSENDILLALKKYKYDSVKIIVTPIGGQGFIFGRGNQQLSAKIIKDIGINNIEIVATQSKIQNLPKKRLFVDTGSKNLDKKLFGYMKVLIDFDMYIMIKIEPV
ncbi:MAG: ATP-NAD kinase [Candidatus Heimdallarchaeota archaeon]|nr:ATP-NAD kinase [Candidatus Heimdallarchaeota archaeon]